MSPVNPRVLEPITKTGASGMVMNSNIRSIADRQHRILLRELDVRVKKQGYKTYTQNYEVVGL